MPGPWSARARLPPVSRSLSVCRRARALSPVRLQTWRILRYGDNFGEGPEREANFIVSDWPATFGSDNLLGRDLKSGPSNWAQIGRPNWPNERAGGRASEQVVAGPADRELRFETTPVIRVVSRFRLRRDTSRAATMRAQIKTNCTGQPKSANVPMQQQQQLLLLPPKQTQLQQQQQACLASWPPIAGPTGAKSIKRLRAH